MIVANVAYIENGFLKAEFVPVEIGRCDTVFRIRYTSFNFLKKVH